MYEITPFLDRKLDSPLYVQLYTYIKREIENGGIPAHSQLPSIRYLSEHLNVSKNTVENAYQQLVAEGYVESRPRSGLMVLEVDQPVWQPDRLVVDNAEDEKESKGMEEVIDFKYGNVDRNHFPMKIWKRCLQEALYKDEAGLFGYGEAKGDLGLRTEIANYLFQSRGVACSPQQIIICGGTQNAISLICQLLSLQGQSIAFEDPGYDGVRKVFLNYGCKITPIKLDSDGINLSKLDLEQKNAAAVYITPSHQFPMGMVLPIQKRLKLLEWAYANDRYIIEDDYDSEFRYQGQPVPSLKALDAHDKVIYLGTFSKSFLPSTRMSYLVLPQTLMQKMDGHLSHYNQTVSPIIQKAMCLFMKEGYFERHIRKMRKIYQVKHKTLLKAVETYFGDQVEIVGSKAGLHLLLQTHNKDNESLIKKAGQYGVKVYSTLKYWFAKEATEPSLIMLGFGALSEKEIEEGIRLLHRAWESIADKG
ncbi:PLP-dependent aminotransferase family protein [Peribacillus sp. SCS-155]|uniref:MocR-like pyridoxine biosynthesis transcription factor PdxR n=1 Tax=Peribacillus sedimenti TaxID=3115297 RepID=UPI0039064C61